MGGTHFLQTGYLLLNRNAPSMLLITLLFHIISLMIVSFKICCKEYLFIYKVPEF